MTTTLTTATPFRVVCPPGCKHAAAEDMHQHEVEVDIDGTLEVQHEVDFGDWAFGNVVQHADGRPDERDVTISPIEPGGGFTDPAALRHLAADLMNAADWLESVQQGPTTPDPGSRRYIADNVRDAILTLRTFNLDQLAAVAEAIGVDPASLLGPVAPEDEQAPR